MINSKSNDSCVQKASTPNDRFICRIRCLFVCGQLYFVFDKIDRFQVAAAGLEAV